MLYLVRHVTRKLFSPKYLLLTNTITSGALMALGDGIQQERERRKAVLKAASALPHGGGVTQVVALKEWDWKRTGNYVKVVCLVTVTSH